MVKAVLLKPEKAADSRHGLKLQHHNAQPGHEGGIALKGGSGRGVWCSRREDGENRKRSEGLDNKLHSIPKTNQVN